MTKVYLVHEYGSEHAYDPVIDIFSTLDTTGSASF
jgi:hypothetical protein